MIAEPLLAAHIRLHGLRTSGLWSSLRMISLVCSLEIDLLSSLIYFIVNCDLSDNLSDIWLIRKPL